ncbi:MAG: hypothetical protein A4E73_02640 [Syntrophaceae bacterium PtaU1.Bin231]|nr:MAG: hypothetical protein A4E73_02640 [Syntrophaceae bacterium PtaU1.Bin231]
MKAIFSDFVIEELWKDPSIDGVFLKARKPVHFIEYDTSNYKLYSIIKNKRALSNRGLGVILFKIRMLARILRKKPLYLKRLTSQSIYEVVTQINHPIQN